MGQFSAEKPAEPGSALSGNQHTEVAWQAKRQSWLLHAHLLATGVTEADWGRLDKAWANNTTADPFEEMSFAMCVSSYPTW